jgi:hypothetical protein
LLEIAPIPAALVLSGVGDATWGPRAALLTVFASGAGWLSLLDFGGAFQAWLTRSALAVAFLVVIVAGLHSGGGDETFLEFFGTAALWAVLYVAPLISAVELIRRHRLGGR